MAEADQPVKIPQPAEQQLEIHHNAWVLFIDGHLQPMVQGLE